MHHSKTSDSLQAGAADEVPICRNRLQLFYSQQLTIAKKDPTDGATLRNFLGTVR